MSAASTTEHLRDQALRSTIEPVAMRVPDACRYVGISRSTLYVLIARREVEIVKLGRSTLVMTESLRQLVDSRRVRRENNAEGADA
jgi:excisionase family DNA binding protein